MAEFNIEQARQSFVTLMDMHPADQTLEALHLAHTEANSMGHNFVGTEHILIALAGLDETRTILETLGLRKLGLVH